MSTTTTTSGCLGPNYNPAPPRAWSRVENPCAYDDGTGYNQGSQTDVYVPVAGTYMTSALYQQYYQPMFLKGNILQYKKNAASLTQKQRYSKIARGQWTNRTKTWATQSQTYTNPNTNSLGRSGAIPLPTPTGYVSPFDCSSNVFLDGGVLVGTTTVTPCSGEVIKETTIQSCNLNDACDVPGPPVLLCWDSKIQPWYPKTRYTMGTSGNKWPVNYKFLNSANSIVPQNRGGFGSY